VRRTSSSFIPASPPTAEPEPRAPEERVTPSGPAATPLTDPALLCARELIETIPAIHRRIGRQMRRSASAPLSVPQLRALRFLQLHPGSSISAIAEHLGVGLPAASALVERLVRAGWVERQADPTERRRMVVRLTNDGIGRLAAAEAAARAWLAGLLTSHPPDEIDALRRAAAILRRLAAAMEHEIEGYDTGAGQRGEGGTVVGEATDAP
jgi:DNA-binding MarR family transcriptional regulator